MENKTWIIDLDPHLTKNNESPVVVITGTSKCEQKENNHYEVVLDNEISISFDVPILSIKNEDDY